MELAEKTIKKNYIYKGKIVNLRRDDAMLPNGRECIREIVEHAPGVCVAAIDENENIILIKQFRYPYMKEITEAPAGKVDPGEDIFAAAVRELREETGIEAEEFDYLGEFYPSCGFTDEIIHLYSARGLKNVGQSLDEDEFLNIEKVPLKDAARMVLKNEIPDGKTQAVILKAYFKGKCD